MRTFVEYPEFSLGPEWFFFLHRHHSEPDSSAAHYPPGHAEFIGQRLHRPLVCILFKVYPLVFWRDYSHPLLIQRADLLIHFRRKDIFLGLAVAGMEATPALCAAIFRHRFPWGSIDAFSFPAWAFHFMVWHGLPLLIQWI